MNDKLLRYAVVIEKTFYDFKLLFMISNFRWKEIDFNFVEDRGDYFVHGRRIFIIKKNNKVATRFVVLNRK